MYWLPLLENEWARRGVGAVSTAVQPTPPTFQGEDVSGKQPS